MKWKRERGRTVSLLIAAAALLVDRAAKIWALGPLTDAGGSMRGIGGVFDFTVVRNSGAAFSVLASHPGIVTALSALILFALGAAVFFGRTLSVSSRACLSLIWAGGVGNLMDRAFYGAVIDFIRLELFVFPIFNFADICVTVGAAWFAVRLLRVRSEAFE